MKKFVDLNHRVAIITYFERPDFGENEVKYTRFKYLGSGKRDQDEQKEYEEMRLIKGIIKPYIDSIEVISSVIDTEAHDKRILGFHWKQITKAWSDVEKEYEGKETTFYNAFAELDI